MSNPFYSGGQCRTKYRFRHTATFRSLGGSGTIYPRAVLVELDGPVFGYKYDVSGNSYPFIDYQTASGLRRSDFGIVFSSAGFELLDGPFVENLGRIDGVDDDCGNIPTDPNGNPASPQPQACMARMSLSK